MPSPSKASAPILKRYGVKEEREQLGIHSEVLVEIHPSAIWHSEESRLPSGIGLVYVNVTLMHLTATPILARMRCNMLRLRIELLT